MHRSLDAHVENASFQQDDSVPEQQEGGIMCFESPSELRVNSRTRRPRAGGGKS